MASTTFCLRLDPVLKRESEILFDELGMTLTGAINAFLKQSLRVGGMPFDMRLEGESLRQFEAIQEAEALLRGESSSDSFPSVDDALAELDRG